MTASLYIHIPFCRKKCPYCDFYKTLTKGSSQSDFCKALHKEAMAYQPKKINIDTIFFGGGTPSSLTEKSLTTIKNSIHKAFTIQPNVEWTMEVNPEDITTELLNKYEALGINRLSIGIQSFNEDELLFLGRQHTPNMIHTALNTLKNHPKKWSFNLDLIFGSPMATSDGLKNSISNCLRYEPQHISTYALTIEKDTPFGKQGIQTIGSDKERSHFEWIIETLTKKGYNQYEISAFCKPNYECKHNLSYWTFKNYIGLGPSAASFYQYKRVTNKPSLQHYLKNPEPMLCHADTQTVPEKTLQSEFIMSHLRQLKGFEISSYNTLFKTDFKQQYQRSIDTLLTLKLIKPVTHNFQITKKGLFFLNEVLMAFI